jgi:hypothetical protein
VKFEALLTVNMELELLIKEFIKEQLLTCNSVIEDVKLQLLNVAFPRVVLAFELLSSSPRHWTSCGAENNRS